MIFQNIFWANRRQENCDIRRLSTNMIPIGRIYSCFMSFFPIKTAWNEKDMFQRDSPVPVGLETRRESYCCCCWSWSRSPFFLTHFFVFPVGELGKPPRIGQVETPNARRAALFGWRFVEQPIGSWSVYSYVSGPGSPAGFRERLFVGGWLGSERSGEIVRDFPKRKWPSKNVRKRFVVSMEPTNHKKMDVKRGIKDNSWRQWRLVISIWLVRGVAAGDYWQRKPLRGQKSITCRQSAVQKYSFW